ncbi:glycoside hydrolase 43 family protein [Paenibacillus sp. FSL H7-0326]|uniref:glycoside hydrolase family 43 protein n=1 Tax=Paenibacillus sp. FSL H7-0326 TaxID=1921144 RepID=UPI00096E4F21|nr:glycoside hydrolase family 43 protein [Paenibacillus sp. FSL H7-0326]OMC71439.1 glycoside hydrolase 43 family protein [Paenibacillus sp. FSL H7-0326]
MSTSAKVINPVISGFHPDPSICRVGSDYYVVTSSFQYFPGVPIFHSRDLVHWKQIGHCLTRKSQLDLDQCKSSMGIYAPTLRFHQGRFYMVTTNMKNLRNFFVWAEKPEGPWSDPIWLDWPGIDPSLFFDDDGRVYISGTNSFEKAETPGIYQAELDIETGSLLSPRRLIWEGTGSVAPEGPHLYCIQGKYYLLIAEGGTEYGHMVTIARGESPYGPFESNPKNPILTHRSTGYPIQATGHADLVQAGDGRWWAVFLGIRPVSVPFRGRHHHLGRETFLAPVAWSSDGWPTIGDGGTVPEKMDVGTLRLEGETKWLEIDHFNETYLQPCWNFIRNPDPNSWSLEERRGWLTLRGSSISLNDMGSPAFVGRRQQHFHCTVSTLLHFEPTREGEEAGLTVYMDERHHYEIGLTLDPQNGRNVFLRRRVGSLWKVELQESFTGMEIVLGVEANESNYSFFYESNGIRKLFGLGECALLSTEVAGGYTGVYFGLYATGNGRSCTVPACFDYFYYSPSKEQ